MRRISTEQTAIKFMKNKLEASGASWGVWALGLAPVLASLISRFFSDLWLADLLAHFHIPALAYLAYVSLRCPRVRKRMLWATVAVGLISFWGLPSPSALQGTAADTRVATFNVGPEVSADTLNQLHHHLRSLSPDVIALEEVSGTASRILRTWKDYPYQVHSPTDDADAPYGTVVLSRFPLTELPVPAFAGNEPYVVRVRVEQPGKPFNVSAVHPFPPVQRFMLPLRNELLRREARWLLAMPERGLLMGDYNATPWAGISIDLAEQGLRRLTSLQPTWGALAKNPLPFLPLDQILGTSGWLIVQQSVDGTFGSDHHLTHVTLQAAPDSMGHTPISWVALTALLVLLEATLRWAVARYQRTKSGKADTPLN